MIWDEFLRHFRFCDEEDSGLSDEELERKGPKNRPKHTRKRIHQAKKNFLEKFKTASYHVLAGMREIAGHLAKNRSKKELKNRPNPHETSS
ncbi:hypothetical protein [Bacteroides sp. An269]|uniref:hypothetical protein n=1 Tax=Bacteroides sp. An269 TaxID=1965613 RepID=UPI0013021BA5|nr:hypothetical protein [Bacteroides sp. An269]